MQKEKGEAIPLRENEINVISNEHAAFLSFVRNCNADKSMVISIKPPEVLRKRYGIKNVLWLTYFGKGNAYSPDRLEFEVLDEVIQFFKKGGRCVLIHGLEYLENVLSREDVFRFIRGVKKEGTTVILAVNHDIDVWRSLGEVVFNKKLKVPEAMVLMAEPKGDVFWITNKGSMGIVISNENDAENLLFSGIRRIKESEGDVGIDCLDYLVTLEPKKSVLFMKDIIDVVVGRGNKVYVVPNPRIFNSSVISIIENTGIEIEEEAFVGREKELEELQKSMEEVLKGRGSAVFISGEAGIGKTTLTRQFMAKAVSRGFLVMKGRAYYSTEEPYLPIKEALEGYVVEIMNNAPLLEARDSKFVEMQRAAIFYEITKKIKKLAEDRPILLFLDDIHWMDAASLKFLHYLAEHTRDSRVMIIATYRPEDMNSELEEVMRRMSRDSLLHVIQLKPLSKEDMKIIVYNILSSADDEVVEAVYRKTGGNPLFAKELLMELKDMGLSRGGVLDEDIPLPQMIRDIIDERFSKLSEREKTMVSYASLIGDFVEIHLIANLMGVDELEIVEMGSNVVKNGIWVESEEEGFMFKHSIIREGIEKKLSALKKKYMHGKIAAEMERMYGELHYQDIAYHYKKAGKEDKAFEYYIKAGEHAEKIYAYENAIKMYQEALKLKKNAKILKKLGYAYAISSNYDLARRYFWEALKLENEDEEKKRIYRMIAKSFESQGDFKKALKYLNAALKIGEEKSPETSRILGMKGWVLIHEGAYEEAKELLIKEMEIAKEIEDKEGIANSHDHLGILYYRMGNYSDAEEHLKKSLELAREIDDKVLECAVLNNLGIVYDEVGNIEKAIEYYKMSAEIAEMMGDKYTLGAVLNNLGVAYQDIGDLEKAKQNILAAMEIEEAVGDKYGLALSYDNIGNINRETGNYEMAINYHLKSIQVGKDIESESIVVESMVSLAEDYFSMGDYEEAKKHAMRAMELADKIHSKPFIRAANRIIAKIYRETGDYEASYNYFMLSLPPENEVSAELGITCYELAKLYKKMNNEEKEEECLKKALGIFQRMGLKKWAEEVRGAMRSMGER